MQLANTSIVSVQISHDARSKYTWNVKIINRSIFDNGVQSKELTQFNDGRIRSDIYAYIPSTR